MTRDEQRRIIAASRTPERAEAIINSRLRREERRAARKAKLSVERYRRERFHEAANKALEDMQRRVAPTVLRVREP